MKPPSSFNLKGTALEEIQGHDALFVRWVAQTKSDGVGLGLSISTRLLEENGGKIEVESELGKGAVFTIFFPLINKNK